MNISQDLRDAKTALENALSSLDVLMDEGERMAAKAAETKAVLVELEARAKVLGPDLDAREAELEQRITREAQQTGERRERLEAREAKCDADAKLWGEHKLQQDAQAKQLDETRDRLMQRAISVENAEKAIERRKAHMAAA